ncbi:dUTP diphosphatase [Solidesulfovibrio sp.]|uniref:dUTP diphosphatase n=1 Tax=Solidesulfovibrio sp. TaxID=2910990 RepID=UPI002B21A012|nr:dUTP diphosphatase [Solidesulfovibrio sp.]MEA5090463.1 dUTP diphosphatase [Solidesulfovibrio sp.]
MSIPTSALRIKFLRESSRVNPPSVATPGSAGMDLRADIDAETLTIAPGARAAIPTGIAIEIETPGLAGFVYSRSGLGAKHGLTVAQGVGVIDPDYRGEIIVWLLNTADEPRTISRHERIAQLILAPVVRPVVIPVEELGDTRRGSGGFGHSGKV